MDLRGCKGYVTVNSIIEEASYSGIILPSTDWHTLTHHGNTARITYRVRVQCDIHYFNSTCTKFCRPRDDKFGHYHCDNNGDKECIGGWRGANCEIAVCKTGCHPIHGKCDQPGGCDTLLQKVDLKKEENLKGARDIDIGYATRSALRKCHGVKDLDVPLFRQDCRTCLKNVVDKLLERSPLKFPLTEALTFLNLYKIGFNQDEAVQQMTSAMAILVTSNLIPGNCLVNTLSSDFFCTPVGIVSVFTSTRVMGYFTGLTFNALLACSNSIEGATLTHRTSRPASAM
uniref:Delta-like protein n=1 Tax=Timema californicum TaxID=61474 RepID=A0A7R9PDG8_TIMCA|nr:unnamed protein product [Timema californicum]